MLQPSHSDPKRAVEDLRQITTKAYFLIQITREVIEDTDRRLSASRLIAPKADPR
jgi:hypothetical protein